MKRKILYQNKLITLIMICSAIFFTSDMLMAQTQLIKLESETNVSFAGETIAVKILYDVKNGNQKTTGIGIRIHFNSKLIENISLSDVYGEGMIGQHYTPVPDDRNYDGDTTTDKYIVIAWASVTRDWPVFLEIPGQLALLNVKIKADAPNAETKINASSSCTAAHYKFDSQSAHLLIQ